MATGQGTVTINFGAFPGSNQASVTFVDAAIGAASKVEPFVMANSTTSDHTANDHIYLQLFAAFSGLPTAGVGGTIYGVAPNKMIGTFKLNYIWAD